MLQAEAIYISKDQQTICITKQAANEVQELASNQEEADTKLILHSLHALATGSSVILRSPSADTDIMVIAFSIIRTDSDISVSDSYMWTVVQVNTEKVCC